MRDVLCVPITYYLLTRRPIPMDQARPLIEALGVLWEEVGKHACLFHLSSHQRREDNPKQCRRWCLGWETTEAPGRAQVGPWDEYY